MTQTSTNQKSHRWDWFLWWRVDPEEISLQAEQYSAISWHKSARGQCLILLLFSALANILLINLNLIKNDSYIDLFIFVILGIFTLFGFRGAIIIAMVFWTMEKIYQIYLSTQGSGNPVLSILWWAIYMHAFFKALKVENARRKLSETI